MKKSFSMIYYLTKGNKKRKEKEFFYFFKNLFLQKKSGVLSFLLLRIVSVK